MESIFWLETYLSNYKGAVIIVAHDRYFLDHVVTKIVELDHSCSTVFTGNYTDYAKKKEQLRTAKLKQYLNQQQEIKHQQEVIAKLKSFNREKSIRRAESSGEDNKSLPRATRVFCPPESVCAVLEKSSSVKPSPFKIPVISL